MSKFKEKVLLKTIGKFRLAKRYEKLDGGFTCLGLGICMADFRRFVSGPSTKQPSFL